MARTLRYVEKMLMRFPAGTIERMDAVLTPLEDRADFVRALVERELRRRERGAEPAARVTPPTARERSKRKA